MENSFKKFTFFGLGILLFGGIIISTIDKTNINFKSKATNSNQMVYSSSNPVVDMVSNTNNGNTIWSKCDGVTWNNGSGKMSFANGAYLENLTVIHGIESIYVDMVSGSVELLYGYTQPSECETPMYYATKITATRTYSFSDVLPSYFRIIAREASVISSIKLNYDCVSSPSDTNLETLEDGLENSYIDAGAIASHPRTSYVCGEGNVSSNSSRALRLDFTNMSNTFVSLNTQTNEKKSGVTKPDFTNVIFTFKAKFSDDIAEYGMRLKAVGAGWADSGYIYMDRDPVADNGWYSYSLDMSSIAFTGNNDIIRLNIEPRGVSSSNKANAYVLLDEIDYHNKTNASSITNETLKDGLENMEIDDGGGTTNCYTTFESDTTYGRTSKTSLLLRPGKEGRSKDGNLKWNVWFTPESSKGEFFDYSSNFTKGTLSFDYKPINVLSPTTIYLRVYRTWSETAKAVIIDSSNDIGDGWYRFCYDLTRLALSDGSCIRVQIGFDVNDANLNSAKFYIDNMKLDNDGKTKEDFTLGWENMKRDTGWERCNVTVDYSNTASLTSTNSMKLTFSGKDSNINKNFICLSPQGQNGVDGYDYTTFKANQGILEAKFKFSEGITNTTIRLIFVDSAWNAARYYNLPTTSIGGGWYQLKVDLSALTTPSQSDAAYNANLNTIRIGFGFEYLTASNKDDKTIWIDDVFYHNTPEISTNTNVTVWQAYNTENIMLTDSVISGRNITSAKPLAFKNIKGGTDSSQIMIKANSAVSSYSFRAPTVKTAMGDTIEPNCFDVMVEKYIYCPSNTSEKYGSSYGWRGAGYYPDALVPIDRIIKAGENTITATNEQGIWVNCEVPTDAVPGTYTGEGILTIDGVEYVVPIEVKVYNATLSETRHSKSLFLLWDDQVIIGEEMDSANRSIRNEYYKFLLNHGINPDHNRDYQWTHDGYTKYESFANDFAEYVMPNPRISTYRIPTDDTYEDIYGYLLALAEKNKEEWDNGNHVNFFDKAVFNVHDEPNEPADKSNVVPDAWNDCKTTQTYLNNAKSAIASSLSGYPEILAGLNSVRSIVAMNCTYDKITGVKYGSLSSKKYPNLLNSTYLDTPCPTFERVNDETQRNAYLAFENTWFYGCCLPNLPYPSFHIDTPLLGQRTISWMQYQYGFEGQLYYCANFYQDQSTTPYSDRDVWSNPLSSGMAAGDGQLMYPGKRYHIYGPISSMRLETLRASYEDYEYFYMLDQNISTYNANTGNSYANCFSFISTETAKMYTGTTLKTRPTVTGSGYNAASFDAYRTFLLEQLEYCF